MPDAVLLEWEGVLADTGSARRDALLRALADEGVPWTAAAYDACCGGLDVRAAAVRALASTGCDDATLADIVALRANRAFVEWLAHGFVLMPDVPELVDAIEHRTRLAIVTRAGRAETEAALRLSGLDRSVGIVVTADDVTDLPPAPALYERALTQLSTQLVRCALDRVVAVVRAPGTPPWHARAAARCRMRRTALLPASPAVRVSPCERAHAARAAAPPSATSAGAAWCSPTAAWPPSTRRCSRAPHCSTAAIAAACA